MTADQLANNIYKLIQKIDSGKLITFDNELLSMLFNKKTSSCLFILKLNRPTNIIKAEDNNYEIILDEHKITIGIIKQLIEKMIKIELN